ncbi:bifunctional adenosylcobinamide kinase/adenosylcobinamide-phosphate guanylyltransferase, partial [Salmonella enterica subsp. enterica serovar Poona]
MMILVTGGARRGTCRTGEALIGDAPRVRYSAPSLMLGAVLAARGAR